MPSPPPNLPPDPSPAPAPRFSIPQLEALAITLAERVGVSHDDARLFAQALVNADTLGTSTHGLSRLGTYLDRLQRGSIDPRATLTIDHQHGAVLALDAANGLGQVAAVKALDLLKPLARTHGLATAVVRRSHHCGALSYFSNLAAAEGFILLGMTNGEASMSPTGGFAPFFGTNPLAISFPVPAADPIKIDLATSITARGNIIAASRKHEPIPEGWALTRDGLPTTDATAALEGTVLTMAGHKGYALALLVEVLSGVLSGAAVAPAVGSMYRELDRPQDVGHFFCLFDLSAFLPGDQYDARIGHLISSLKDSSRQPGIDEILLPGERSARTAARNRADGITLSPDTLAELSAWCDRLNVPPLPRP